MAKLPYVFIGSSKEGLDAAKAIQSNLQYCCESHIWHQGLFGLSSGTLETLVNKLDSFDFAILCLTPDDMTTSRGQEKRSPRDNVILELGLFMGKLGRERVYIVIDREADAKMPSDLAGITPAQFKKPDSGNWQSALGPACNEIEVEIKRIGSKGGEAELNFLISPFAIGDKKVSMMMVIENRNSKPFPPYTVRLKYGKVNHFPFKTKQDDRELLTSQFRLHEFTLVESDDPHKFKASVEAMVKKNDGTFLSDSELSEFSLDLLLKDSYTVLFRSEELGFAIAKCVKNLVAWENGADPADIYPSDAQAIFAKYRLGTININT